MQANLQVPTTQKSWARKRPPHTARRQQGDAGHGPAPRGLAPRASPCLPGAAQGGWWVRYGVCGSRGGGRGWRRGGRVHRILELEYALYILVQGLWDFCTKPCTLELEWIQYWWLWLLPPLVDLVVTISNIFQ